jgi:MFS family permease
MAGAQPAPAAGRRMFAAFAHRSFRLWFVGQTVSLVGTWMQNMAQSWLVYQITGSSLLLGAVNTCSSLPMLLFALWGGVLADRFPKRRILILTQAMLMLLAFALAILAAGPWVRFWQVLVIATLGGVVMAFDMPARQAMVMELVGEKDLMNAVALNATMFNSARIVGPMIAGLLMPLIQASGCFLLNGVSFLAVLLSLLLMRHAEHEPANVDQSPWHHATEGFRYVRARPEILRLFVQLAILGIFGWTYTVLMPVFARDVLRVGERGFGMLLTANGAGALGASLAIAARGHHGQRERRVFLGVLLFAAAQLLFSLSRWFPLSLVCMAIAGWAMITFFTTANTIVQTTTPDALRGRVMGIYTLTFTGTSPIGALQAGTLAEHFGAPIAVRISATVCAISAATLLLLLPPQARAPQEAGELPAPRRQVA